MHTDHAMALDFKGHLYAWGSNLSKRAGFKDEIYDGIFEPRRVTFYEGESLIPLQVSCGFDHTLILFEEQSTKLHKVYSVGTSETNYHHLGISDIEAGETKVYYRELSVFRGFNILDIAAGHRSSHVIIEGDKEILSNLYEHKVPDNKVAKGILHFYFDSEGKPQYLT